MDLLKVFSRRKRCASTENTTEETVIMRVWWTKKSKCALKFCSWSIDRMKIQSNQKRSFQQDSRLHQFRVSLPLN